MTPKEIIAGLQAINNGTDRDCLDGQSCAAVDLAGYVRQDAIDSLLGHWNEHLRSNTLASIIGDIDDIIDELRAFERAVRFRFAAEFEK
jgi:hypothetical protein